MPVRVFQDIGDVRRRIRKWSLEKERHAYPIFVRRGSTDGDSDWKRSSRAAVSQACSEPWHRPTTPMRPDRRRDASAGSPVRAEYQMIVANRVQRITGHDLPRIAFDEFDVAGCVEA